MFCKNNCWNNFFLPFSFFPFTFSSVTVKMLPSDQLNTCISKLKYVMCKINHLLYITACLNLKRTIVSRYRLYFFFTVVYVMILIFQDIQLNIKFNNLENHKQLQFVILGAITSCLLSLFTIRLLESQFNWNASFHFILMQTYDFINNSIYVYKYTKTKEGKCLRVSDNQSTVNT